MSLPIELAIDFGTSNTVAVIRNADGGMQPLIIDGSPLLPSAVFAEATGGIIVGRDAAHAAQTAPERFEPNPKQRIDDGSVLLGDRDVPVGDLFAAVLERVRREYEAVTTRAPGRTAVTYPAAWGSLRLLTLRNAAERAGLGVIETVSEPVAAAAYITREFGPKVEIGSSVFVYDVGGGTFDTSVLRRTPTGFEVLTVDGLNDLGGLDIDELLAGALRSRYPDEENWARLLDRADPASRHLSRAFQADVRELKERLSRSTTSSMRIPLLEVDAHLTRTELDELIRPILARAGELAKAVLLVSGVPPTSLAGVFGVGGGSRMPLVSTIMHGSLGIPPKTFGQPELVVAQGAIWAVSGDAGAVPVSAPPTSAPPVDGTFGPQPTPGPSSGQFPIVTPYAPPRPDGTPAWGPASHAAAPPPDGTSVSGPPFGPQPTPPGPPTGQFPTVSPFGPPPPPPRRRSATAAVLVSALAVVIAATVGIVLVVKNMNGTPPAGADPTPGPTVTLAEDVAGTFTGHGDTVETVDVFRHDDRWLVVSGGWDRALVWDLETQDVVQSFLDQEGRVETDVTTVDGKPVVVSYVNSNPSGENPVMAWDPMTGEEMWTFQVDEDPDDTYYSLVNELSTGVLGDRSIATGVLYIGDEEDEDYVDRQVVTWDLTTGEEMSRGDVSSYGWISTAIVKDDIVAVLPDDDGDEVNPNVVVWDLESGKESHRVGLEGTGRYGLVTGEIDRVPVTVAADQGEGVLVRRMDDGGLLWTYEGHDGALEETFATCDWGGRSVVVSGDDAGGVHVWSVGEEIVRSEQVGDETVMTVDCLSVDGRLVVLAGVGDAVEVLDFGKL